MRGKRAFSDLRNSPLPSASDTEGEKTELLASKWLLSLAAAPIDKDLGRRSVKTEDVENADSRSCASTNSTPSSGGRSCKRMEVDRDEDSNEDEDEDQDMDDEVSGSSSVMSISTTEGDRKRTRGSRSAKSITLDELRLHFDKPIEEAARGIGICSTLLKKICRRYNIKRWPYRQIKSLDRTIECLKLAAQNAAPEEESRFQSQITILETRRTELIQTSTFENGRIGMSPTRPDFMASLPSPTSTTRCNPPSRSPASSTTGIQAPSASASAPAHAAVDMSSLPPHSGDTAWRMLSPHPSKLYLAPAPLAPHHHVGYPAAAAASPMFLSPHSAALGLAGLGGLAGCMGINMNMAGLNMLAFQPATAAQHLAALGIQHPSASSFLRSMAAMSAASQLGPSLFGPQAIPGPAGAFTLGSPTNAGGISRSMSLSRRDGRVRPLTSPAIMPAGLQQPPVLPAPTTGMTQVTTA